MTRHFAYPNVIPREDRFIGCGRYAVFSPTKSPSAGYRPITRTPNTPNRFQVEHAIQLLCPESYDAEKKLYERPDEPERVYQGDSMDLAYVLAHIHRTREFKGLGTGDIWCTGVVNVQKDGPILVNVDPKGFELKLNAFLSDAQQDPIFIVPAANVTDETAHRIKSSGNRLLSIRQFGNGHVARSNRPKIVLKVLSNELPSLLDLLFKKKPSTFRIRISWIIICALALAMALTAWWAGTRRPAAPPPKAIEELLESGDFSEARRLLSAHGKQSPELSAASNIMETPAAIDLGFIVKKADAEIESHYSIEDADLTHLSLSHKDDYRFQITVKNPSSPLFMYIFQMDDSGSLDRIYPNPTWKLENPIQTPAPLLIPPSAHEWLYLEPLGQQQAGTLRETLLVLISPWRAKDIESLYEKITGEADKSHRRRLIEALAGKVRERGRAGILSIYFKEWSFEHGN